MPVTKALYFCELEIPAGSRSGRLRHQGGMVNLVVQGSGYTRLDDVDHEWEQRDVIALPVRPDGVLFQHFNNGTGVARLVFAWPNLDSAFGPGAGVAMEVLEPAPEFAALRVVSRTGSSGHRYELRVRASEGAGASLYLPHLLGEPVDGGNGA